MRLPALVSFFLIVVGTSMLLWVGWPIVSFILISQPLLTTTISPISQESSDGKRALAQVVLAAGDPNSVGPVGSDYTNANVWFPTLPQKKVVTPVNTYTLSIPKLGINGAIVTIGGDDLNHSLIHYGGTGLPGDYGNAVVFGHSTLPQFYNPKNYTTIFSTLPTLTEGDDMFIAYDGITYRYQVFKMVVLSPTDLSLLAQLYDDSYVTLVTCVPPGTYWKRLYVVARLVRPGGDL